MAASLLSQSQASYFRDLPFEVRQERLSLLTDEELAFLNYDWSFWARPSQLPPLGDWDIWLIMSGRGFGKTRSGAEWVKDRVDSGLYGRVMLVADDAKDARDVMIEGESGLLAIYPKADRPRYIASQAKVEWPNGATAILYSANDPESLRGPQGDTAWCDELAKWRYQRKAWDMLMFGMRLGPHPQTVVTTTPTPTPVMKELVATAKVSHTVRITGGPTHDNLENLAPAFARQIMKYEGTRLGRQELYAELLEDVQGALWTLEMIDRCQRVYPELPDFKRIVVAVDPAVSVGKNANETGIIVVGTYPEPATRELVGVVLDDRSGVYSPLGWANQVNSAFKEWNADRVVGETNQGGDLIESNLKQVNPAIPFKGIVARKGKYLRAEPVAALYEKNRVFHYTAFPELESQLTEWVAGEDSPDRLDALVHGLTDLMINVPTGRQAIVAGATTGVVRANSLERRVPGNPFTEQGRTKQYVHPGRL